MSAGPNCRRWWVERRPAALHLFFSSAVTVWIWIYCQLNFHTWLTSDWWSEGRFKPWCFALMFPLFSSRDGSTVRTSEGGKDDKSAKVVLFWVHYLSRNDVLSQKQLGEKTGFRGQIAHKQDVGWKWWKWQSTRLRTCKILHAPAAAVNLSPFEAHRRVIFKTNLVLA